MSKHITVKEVKDIVNSFTDSQNADYEGMHVEEDDMYEDVLSAVAEGDSHSKLLAREALKSKNVKFTRWYA
ncbi:hypothetical protein [Limosilactobacillus reuteri]|uniref:hypothetical protein n=1 Tax=Limosilactobacillus reuteri TaxID=1598 RepID=UPI00143D25D8|nr:hypothetical protein [Limosilactobacillus reuteri]QIZ04176.1 hypothetical protein GXL24_04005 [Limosilactobacillus reuteri]